MQFKMTYRSAPSMHCTKCGIVVVTHILVYKNYMYASHKQFLYLLRSIMGGFTEMLLLLVTFYFVTCAGFYSK